MRTREAARRPKLIAQGSVLATVAPAPRPGEWRTLGLFNATDPTDL